MYAQFKRVRYYSLYCDTIASIHRIYAICPHAVCALCVSLPDIISVNPTAAQTKERKMIWKRRSIRHVQSIETIYRRKHVNLSKLKLIYIRNKRVQKFTSSYSNWFNCFIHGRQLVQTKYAQYEPQRKPKSSPLIHVYIKLNTNIYLWMRQNSDWTNAKFVTRGCCFGKRHATKCPFWFSTGRLYCIHFITNR